jgi:hypothetical protein
LRNKITEVKRVGESRTVHAMVCLFTPKSPRRKLKMR